MPAVTKQCPFCAEEILAEAKKCKHCGEMLAYKPVVIEKTSKTLKREMLQSACVGFGGFFLLLIGGGLGLPLLSFIGLIGMIAGVVGYVGAKGRAWWHHG